MIVHTKSAGRIHLLGGYSRSYVKRDAATNWADNNAPCALHREHLIEVGLSRGAHVGELQDASSRAESGRGRCGVQAWQHLVARDVLLAQPRRPGKQKQGTRGAWSGGCGRNLLGPPLLQLGNLLHQALPQGQVIRCVPYLHT